MSPGATAEDADSICIILYLYYVIYYVLYYIDTYTCIIDIIYIYIIILHALSGYQLLLLEIIAGINRVPVQACVRGL